MCAINGFVRNNRFSPEQANDQIKRMNESNSFRGPDYSGTWTDEFVYLGHNLLAITGDVETSQQPFITKKGNVLVYNGEYFDVREFDTPIFAEGFEKSGVNFLKNTNSHFGMAYYDVEKKHLTIARDHFGVKSVYYHLTDDEFCFSSSIHGISSYVKLDVDEDRLELMRSTMSYHWGECTPFRNVKRLFPGEYITYDVVKKKIISKGTLHDYTLGCENTHDDDIKQLIIDSIKDISYTKDDVLLAMGLSGGLDSSVIAHVLEDEEPFMITSHYEKINPKAKHYAQDEKIATAMAYRLDRPIYFSNLSKEIHEDNKGNVIQSLMMPLQDYERQVPRFLLVKKAKELGARVIITGDGADEIFTGYFDHGRFHKQPLWRLKEGFERTKLKWSNEFVGDFPFHCFGPDIINNYLFCDLFRTVNTYNIGMDSHSGYHSMESRAPYLRQKLVLAMMNCDGKKKLRLMKEVEDVLNSKQHTKYYLRKLFYNELPRSVTHKAQKAGFCAPYGDVLTPQKTRENRDVMINDFKKYIDMANSYWHG